MQSKVVSEIVESLESVGVEDGGAVALYALALGLEGTSVLNGTTNEARMRKDLEALALLGRNVEGDWKEEWQRWLKEFKVLIGEV